MQSNFEALTEYEIRHLLSHLVACGRASVVHIILAFESDDGRNAWYVRRTRANTDADFQRDIDLAASIAGADQSYSALILSARYQIISNSLSAIHARFPPLFVAELVSKGVWSARQALETIDFLTDQIQRTSMLEAIAPKIPADYRGRLLDLARTMPATGKELNFEPNDYPDIIATSPKAEMLALVSVHYQGEKAEALAEEAIAAALQINDKADRARCLGRLLPNLTPHQQHKAADLILTITDAETNPDRVYLTLPVLKTLPQHAEGILQRIGPITDAASGSYSKQSLRYLAEFFSALSQCGREVVREALNVATRRAAKPSARGLLEGLSSGDLDPGLITECAPRCPSRILKAHEWEWIPLFVALARADNRTIETRLNSIKYGEHRIEFYLRIRNCLDPQMDRTLAERLVETIPEVRGLEERVRLAAGLLKTGELSRSLVDRLASESTEYAAQIRNPPPRFKALLNLVDAVPTQVRLIDILVATIGQLQGKVTQAEAWLECASRIEASPYLAEHDPWGKAKHVLRKVSPQDSRSKLLIGLFALRPGSCFGELESDVLSLEPEFRVRTLVRSMQHFDFEQKKQAYRWFFEMVERTNDSETQQMVLNRSAQCLDAAALSQLVRLFGVHSGINVQYSCLARIASGAPATLIAPYVEFILGRPRGACLTEDAIIPIARWLSVQDARRVFASTRHATSPQSQAEIFHALSAKLPASDHEAALERALQINHRLVRISVLATVVDRLKADVLFQYRDRIRGDLPAATKSSLDHSGDPLYFALSKNFARHGEMGEAVEYLTMSRSQEDHLLGMAREFAGDKGAFDYILGTSHNIFNLDARARIQMALLAWRAKFGWAKEAFQAMLELDSHCMPVVLDGLSPWLDEGQIKGVLSMVDAFPKAHAPRPESGHVWQERDQRSIATYTTSMTGYFAPTPTEPPSASALVPPLLPRLVAMGREEEAWAYLHYAQDDGQVAHFITNSTSLFSDHGLTEAIDLALSISNGSAWIAAVTAVAIECAKRGRHDAVERLVKLLPPAVQEQSPYYRHRSMNRLAGAQLHIVRSAREVLPEELTEEIAPSAMAGYPQLAARVCCLASAADDVTPENVTDLFRHLSENGDGKFEVAAVEYLVSRGEAMPTATLRRLIEEALGGGQTFGARRTRGNALAVTQQLVPAIARLDGEQSIVALYNTVKQVCRWWN